MVLDFGKPDNAIAAALYRAYLRAVMPLMGWIFHGDPDTYLYIPESLERYPGQRGVEKLMREAGFGDVRYEDRLLGTMGLNVGEAPPDIDSPALWHTSTSTRWSTCGRSCRRSARSSRASTSPSCRAPRSASSA